ncbi:DUF397 domain-containing protein [Streptomyces fagopyri]|uniref:DUF397 domain-containing protein n=1 Tax=Streptomyces fagopyri TaxID=2662397 RepID=A0A5Q0LNW7_9ACTN|nr:DUF397 domain-containing protein [Streptomyces fagopyri]
MASHEIDLSTALWRKSSNGTGGDCVEIAAGLSGVVPIRDAKLQDSPVLLVQATSWSTFLANPKP